jgi:hypothetical protein
MRLAVLQIQDVYPGSRYTVFIYWDPGPETRDPEKIGSQRPESRIRNTGDEILEPLIGAGEKNPIALFSEV